MVEADNFVETLRLPLTGGGRKGPLMVDPGISSKHVGRA
jgi:hypothetical protein